MPGRKTRKDDALLIALASGQSLPAAAQTAGISESTAHRRMADPAFREKLKALRARIVDEAAGLLAAGMTRAAQVLIDLLADPGAKIRLGSAVALLDRAGKYVELSDLQVKVSRLEELLTELKGAINEAG